MLVAWSLRQDLTHTHVRSSSLAILAQVISRPDRDSLVRQHLAASTPAGFRLAWVCMCALAHRCSILGPQARAALVARHLAPAPPVERQTVCARRALGGWAGLLHKHIVSWCKSPAALLRPCLRMLA